MILSNLILMLITQEALSWYVSFSSGRQSNTVDKTMDCGIREVEVYIQILSLPDV